MKSNSQKFIEEKELILRLSKKDDAAFSYLYDNYASYLYYLIFKIAGNDELAEDIMQETFMKIWSNFSQYNSSKGKLFTWLLNVARNTALDHLKSKGYKNRKNHVDTNIFQELITSKAVVYFNPEEIGVKKLVYKLQTKQQQIIILAYFHGYTQSEIAKELNIPLGTVKTRMRMAILKLRKLV